MNYQRISYWFDSLDEAVGPPGLPEPLPRRTDVAIIGGGLTGMWTAYYLKSLAPELDVTLLEAEVAGFGASGRNGGWCMGSISSMEDLLEDQDTREDAIELQRVLWQVPDEVERVCLAEGIDCDYHKGGWISVARTPEAATELARWAEFTASLGLTGGASFLDQAEAHERLATPGNYGALFDPNGAALNPARLARGLAAANRRLGVRILEQTRVIHYDSGEVATLRGHLTADTVLRATEGYTASLRQQKRRLLPLYSMVLATEPLSEHVWQEIGIRNRETFGDTRLVEVYGQRTGDNRLIFGGRATCFWNSQLLPVIPARSRVFERLIRDLHEFLPQVRTARITHRWGGLMGVASDWQPFVHFDPARRLGSAGGYVGEGVGASNLAGATLAHLTLGSDDHITRLLWVRKEEPMPWVPEPLRWLGANAAVWLADQADRTELAGRPGGWQRRLFDWLTG